MMSRSSEIQVMSSSAMKAAYLELVPGFERVTGHRVVTHWIPGVDLMRRVKDGEVSDIVIMQRSSIEELIALGRIAPGSRVDLARSGVGVAVKAGAQKPDISSGVALKRALLAAEAVGFSTVTKRRLYPAALRAARYRRPTERQGEANQRRACGRRSSARRGGYRFSADQRTLAGAWHRSRRTASAGHSADHYFLGGR